VTFSDEKIQKVWRKGEIIPQYDSDKYRQDRCTAWMKWDEYGNRESILGWGNRSYNTSLKGWK